MTNFTLTVESLFQAKNRIRLPGAAGGSMIVTDIDRRRDI